MTLSVAAARVAILSATFYSVVTSAQPAFAGRTVAEVIEELRDQGIQIVYSSTLVGDDLRIMNEPDGATVLAKLGNALSVHGLELVSEASVYLVERAEPSLAGSISVEIAQRTTLFGRVMVRLEGPDRRSMAVTGDSIEFTDLPAGEYLVSVEALLHQPASQVVTLRAAQRERVTLMLAPAAPLLEEVLVGASRYDIARDGQYASAYFNRAEVENLSDLGGDPLRVVHRLPGAASGGYSAKSHIRGGATDEMTIVLDGLELVDPFHIRDFQSLFSTINQRAVSSIQVYSGGFPAEYGDTLSGLMLVESRVPEQARAHEVGVSLLSTSLLSSGTFRSGQSDWLVALRRGNLDLLLDPQFGKPSYKDGYAHVGFDLSGGTHLTINGLASEDDILVIAEDDGINQENAHSDTDNLQVWLKLENIWNDRLSSDTVLSSSHFSNARSGVVVDPEEIDAQVTDRRVLDIIGIKQDWEYAWADRQLLKWGFDARRLSANYDYSSQRALFGFFAAFRGTPVFQQRNIALAPKGNTYAVYLSDRLSFGERAVIEVGIRWDEQTYLPSSTRRAQSSSRLSALYRLSPRTDFRASWGRFYQSQDILGLQVEDGLAQFTSAQLATHSIVSVEHLFPNEVSARIEVYRKRMPQLAPRFENLFETLGLLPEVRPDRIRIDSGRASAYGVELLISRSNPDRFTWWGSYTRARVADTVDGSQVSRSWDQRHAVSGGITWQGKRWTVTPTASFHTGWPTTELTVLPLAAENGDPPYEVVSGERNSQRLGNFERIDLRAARLFELTRGSLEVFGEATNLLDRENPCCVDYRVQNSLDAVPALERSVDHWMPRVVSVGFLWEF